MNKFAERFGWAAAVIALFLANGAAHAKREVRIDATSDKSVEQSYKRMSESLHQEAQVELATAILKLNMVGINSVEEMLADPELRSPGPVRIKDVIAGLTAAEIIELADKTSTVRIITPGQEPGVPADLLTPLAAGNPSYSLTSTKWKLVSNTNGYIKEQTLEFHSDGKLETNPPSTAGTSSWEQSADEVRIFINDSYAVSRGKFVDAEHIQGTGGNKVGSTWIWNATRQ